MADRLKKWVSWQQILEAGKRLFSFLFALYLIFILGRVVYQNYRVRERIDTIENEIRYLKSENQRLANLIAYYQTETFRELEARSKLGLKKPGEIVIALPENNDEEPVSPREAQPAKEPDQTPNYIKWWGYIFGE
jgi:cell division protein FtsB